jgi:cytoskeletal protein CcmA (bactofilin family)
VKNKGLSVKPMTQAETQPQSIVNVKTVVLKPRLDVDAVNSIGEKTKINLFSKFGFKPKPRDVEIISFENYYEPYFIIGGRYSIDYCKEHPLRCDVNNKVNKLYIAGQEFNAKSQNSKKPKKILKLTGEEHSHYEKETFFILDRNRHEVSPEKLPFSPFNLKNRKCEITGDFKSISIPTNIQIDFLKSKIAIRPSELVAIIKEIFEITDRTIVYTPMYQITFKKLKTQIEAAILINGITGETKTIRFGKTISDKLANSTESVENQHNASKETEPKQESHVHAKENSRKNVFKENRIKPKPALNVARESMVLGFPAKISGEVFSVGDNVTAIVGDIAISSGSNIKKTLVVKGTLKIGDNCEIIGRLKALEDVTIGTDTTIEGDVIAGGNVFVGERSIINGSIEAKGTVEISKDAAVERGLHSNYAIQKLSIEMHAISETENAKILVER